MVQFRERLALIAKTPQYFGALAHKAQHLNRDALVELLISALRQIDDRGTSTARLTKHSIIPDDPPYHVDVVKRMPSRRGGSAENAVRALMAYQQRFDFGAQR